MDYKFNTQFIDTHRNFNYECHVTGKDRFKSNRFMSIIVQNCPHSDGLKHLEFITKHSDILTKLDFDKLKLYDSVGGPGAEDLIFGLSPKIYSYIKEILIFYDICVDKNTTEIDNLLVIGGGYGMEMVLIYEILLAKGVRVNNIIGIDMDHVAALQNYFFQQVGMEHVCKSYTCTFRIDNIDYLYSNCCLSEVPPSVNYEYYTNFFLKSHNVHIVWTILFADIPDYYKSYIDPSLDTYNLDRNVNVLISKIQDPVS
jgi:hypothetical protein